MSLRLGNAGNVHASLTMQTIEVVRVLRSHALCLAESHFEATVLVCENLSDVPREAMFLAALEGKFICTVGFLRGRGAGLQYKSLIARERKVYVSPSFAGAYFGEATCIVKCCSQKGSRWRLHEERRCKTWLMQ